MNLDINNLANQLILPANMRIARDSTGNMIISEDFARLSCLCGHETDFALSRVLSATCATCACKNREFNALRMACEEYFKRPFILDAADHSVKSEREVVRFGTPRVENLADIKFMQVHKTTSIKKIIREFARLLVARAPLPFNEVSARAYNRLNGTNITPIRAGSELLTLESCIIDNAAAK